MIKQINILTLSLFCLILTYCGQANTKKQSIINKTQNQFEKRYTRIISDSTNILTNKVENLEIEYTVWGCACPQWIQTKDNQSNDTTRNYLKLHFYIEPADKTLELPNYFDAFRHRLRITGQFYAKEDYPKGTIEMEEPMPKAKVFRYTKIEVIEKTNFKLDNKIEEIQNGKNKNGR
ncbi:MAG: hypothetical protein IT243_10500 [Bacteroidia bacterium]|nr:hypothetical protein [Bacteroidia bacterium]